MTKASSLSEADRTRYSRQIAIEGFGVPGQERLRRSRVFIAGSGGLGCAAAIYLAAAGIGRLRIADSGEVELSDLNRQIAFGDRDLGLAKAERIAARIAEANPSVEVEPLRVAMGAGNLAGLLAGCDVVVDALDSIPTWYALNEAALGLGIPLVHGAAQGFCGQLLVVMPGEGACLMCLYRGKASSGPVPVVGAAPGAIGTLQAMEAIKLIAGMGRPAAGRLLVLDGLDMTFSELAIPRDPDCPHCRGIPRRGADGTALRRG